MELTTIREIFKNREDYLDKKVTVGGWLRSIRDSKTFGNRVRAVCAAVRLLRFEHGANSVFASFIRPRHTRER